MPLLFAQLIPVDRGRTFIITNQTLTEADLPDVDELVLCYNWVLRVFKYSQLISGPFFLQLEEADIKDHDIEYVRELGR